MANGPLTPPPTTAAELQDEARSADVDTSSSLETPVAVTAPVAPQAQTSSSVQPPAQDYYQRIFPAIAERATESKLEDLIHLAESSDLNVRPTTVAGLTC